MMSLCPICHANVSNIDYHRVDCRLLEALHSNGIRPWYRCVNGRIERIIFQNDNWTVYQYRSLTWGEVVGKDRVSRWDSYQGVIKFECSVPKYIEKVIERTVE